MRQEKGQGRVDEQIVTKQRDNKEAHQQREMAEKQT